MNSKERFKTALARQAPDCIPIAPHFGGGKCFTPVAGGYTLADFAVADNKKVAQIYLKCHEKYPADWIYAISSGRDKKWFTEHTIHHDKEGCEVIDIKTGKREFYPHWKENPWVHGNMAMEEALKLEVVNNSEKIIEMGQTEVLEILNKEKGKEVMITAGTAGPVHYICDWIGVENYLFGLKEKTDILQKLFQKAVDNAITRISAYQKIGINFVSICETLCGTDVISPESYRKVILPYHRQLLERVPEGMYTCFEIGGNIVPIMDEIISCGVDCVWPEMPLRGFQELDIETLVEVIKGRVAIISNFDVTGLLIRGSKEEIESEAKRMLKIGKRTKGFILGTGCSIAWNTPEEKIKYFFHSAMNFR